LKYTGLKVGLVFFVLSILLTLTLVGPAFIPMFAEGIGKSVDQLFKIGNISGTTFYTCTIICVICFSIYIFALVKYRQNSLTYLTIFFISIFIFFNAALFYYNIRLPDSHIDGQQIFDSIDKPIKTCLLYIVLGFGHDLLINRQITTSKEIAKTI
jgi:hypothetical protein